MSTQRVHIREEPTSEGLIIKINVIQILAFTVFKTLIYIG